MDAPAMSMALWMLIGLTAGAAHFALLRWNATLYAAAGGIARGLTAQALRMAVMTALLALAAWHGALPLLSATIGVLFARLLVLRVLAVVP
jgi:hypothetical protein